VKQILLEIFNKLNAQLEVENNERKISGSRLISKARITILGQTSLLAQPELTHMLSLAQTGDLDAKLIAEHAVKRNLKEILPKYGLVYDEDSGYIFIPEGSQFVNFVNLSLIDVQVIDPESALVSKAVKSAEKNIQLIRQAIASGHYPNLVQRIIDNKGDLEKFI
jgi:hypothetical protein